VSGWYGGNIMLAGQTGGTGTGCCFADDAVFAPEASTWAMMLTGFAGLAFAAHRARKSAAAAA